MTKKTVYRFTVPGIPVPKLRARTTWGPNGPHTYTPDDTVAGEYEIRCEAKAAGVEQLTGPVALTVRLFLRIPRMSKRKAAFIASGALRPVVRPDWDNLAKLVSDALVGMAYHDDNQVVEAHVEKWYSDEPRTEVEVGQV